MNHESSHIDRTAFIGRRATGLRLDKNRDESAEGTIIAVHDTCVHIEDDGGKLFILAYPGLRFLTPRAADRPATAEAEIARLRARVEELERPAAQAPEPPIADPCPCGADAVACCIECDGPVCRECYPLCGDCDGEE